MPEARYESFGFGLLLIFCGLLVFLVNAGHVQWEMILLFLVLYWPIFIILAGIRMIGNAQFRTGIFGIVIDIAFYVIVLAGLVYGKEHLFPSFPEAQLETMVESVSQAEFPTAQAKNYQLNFGAANITIQDENTSKYLDVTGTSPLHVSRPTDSSTESPLFEVSNQSAENVLRFANFRRAEKFTVDIGMPELPTAIDLKLGASNANLSFDQTVITSFQSTVGAGNLEATLSGPSIPSTITLKIGAGRTALRIAGNQSVGVHYSVGAGSLKLVSKSKQLNKELGGIGTNGVYEILPNPQVQVNVTVGAGRVEIEVD